MISKRNEPVNELYLSMRKETPYVHFGLCISLLSYRQDCAHTTNRKASRMCLIEHYSSDALNPFLPVYTHLYFQKHYNTL